MMGTRAALQQSMIEPPAPKPDAPLARVQQLIGNQAMLRRLALRSGGSNVTASYSAPAVRASRQVRNAPILHEGGAGHALGSAAPQAVPHVVDTVLRSEGQPLEPSLRSSMEARFGHSFGDVRVHDDARANRSAEALEARAYTHGHNVVFAARAFSPATGDGQHLLAHELAHVVQQRAGGPASFIQREPQVSGPKAPMVPLETIANRIAQLALGPSQARVQSKLGVPRGPVITVVRDLETGDISVGLNTGLPEGVSVTPEGTLKGEIPAALKQRIEEQIARIASGEAIVVHTVAPGEHSEVNAMNAALATRQARTGKSVATKEFSTFEMHNVWLQGEEPWQPGHSGRVLETAARCEHCEYITRGVKLSSSLFQAEGGGAGPGGGAGGAHGTGGQVETDPAGNDAPAGARTSPGALEEEGSPAGAMGGAATFRGGLLRVGAEVGENLIVSLISDYVNAKIAGHFDRKYFAERMEALKPDIDVAKFQAYEGLAAARRAQMGTLFFSVTIEVTVTLTTAIGGGHAVVMSSGPVPRLISVTIVDAAGRSETPLEMKTLAVAPANEPIVQTGQSQVVTYTQPIPAEYALFAEAMKTNLQSFPFFANGGKAANQGAAGGGAETVGQEKSSGLIASGAKAKPAWNHGPLRFARNGELVTSDTLLAWAHRNFPRGLDKPGLKENILASHEFEGSDEQREGGWIDVTLRLRPE